MRRLAGCGRQFVGHMLPTMPSTVYLQPSCIMTAHSDRISVLHRKFGYLLESDWNSQNSQSGNQSSYSTRIGISIALLVYMLLPGIAVMLGCGCRKRGPTRAVETATATLHARSPC